MPRPRTVPVKRALEMYDHGLKTSQIGRVLGCHPTSILYHLKRSGYKLPRTAWLKQRATLEAEQALSDEQIAVRDREMVRMYMEERMSFREIGRRIGKTHNNVGRILRRQPDVILRWRPKPVQSSPPIHNPNTFQTERGA